MDEDIAKRIREVMQEIAEAMGGEVIEISRDPTQASQNSTVARSQKAAFMTLLSRLGGQATMTEDEVVHVWKTYELCHRMDSGTDTVQLYLRTK